jgi:hypothetical protein
MSTLARPQTLSRSFGIGVRLGASL